MSDLATRLIKSVLGEMEVMDFIQAIVDPGADDDGEAKTFSPKHTKVLRAVRSLLGGRMMGEIAWEQFVVFMRTGGYDALAVPFLTAPQIAKSVGLKAPKTLESAKPLVLALLDKALERGYVDKSPDIHTRCPNCNFTYGAKLS